MKATKVILAMVFLMAVGTFVSCEKTSIAEEEQLHTKAIDGNEIEDGDM